jgi:hypothetical protein
MNNLYITLIFIILKIIWSLILNENKISFFFVIFYITFSNVLLCDRVLSVKNVMKHAKDIHKNSLLIDFYGTLNRLNLIA